MNEVKVSDLDRTLARRAVGSCPVPPCGTHIEMQRWREEQWIEPYAKALADARAAEREECAKIADGYARDGRLNKEFACEVADEIAAHIRYRESEVVNL